MNLDEVRLKAKAYDEQYQLERKSVPARFKTLVNKHGVSFVAAASGLSESSVATYSRSKVVPVSIETLRKAETILG